MLVYKEMREEEGRGKERSERRVKRNMSKKTDSKSEQENEVENKQRMGGSHGKNGNELKKRRWRREGENGGRKESGEGEK